MRDGHARLRLHVRAGKPFHALEVRLGYEPGQLEVTGVRMRRPRAGVLVQYGTDRHGHAAIALAGARPVDNHRGAILLIDFAGHAEQFGASEIRVVHAAIDEGRASVVRHEPRSAR